MGLRNIGAAWRRALLIAALAWTGVGSASAADWVYRVRPGDNLWDLAAAHLKADVPWSRLQAYNNVPHPRHLPPGQRLRFPVEWLRVQPERVRVVAVRGAVRIAVDGRAAAYAGTVDMRIATNGWVETGEDASATVEFADGSRLLLASRSHVVFDRLSSFGKTGMVDSEVRLQRGRATHRVAPQNGPAARYEVSTPSATSSVRGTRFRVAYEDGRETTEVVEGHVGVDGGTGSAELRAGYGSRNDGGVRARALLPAPDLPAATFDSLPILLEWPPVPGASGYQIDVVRADAPEVQLFEAAAASPKVAIGTLPAGHHLIRVRAVDAEGIAGMDATLPIEIPEGPAPPLTIRPANAEVSYLPKPRFEWSRSEGAEGARVQIARDAAMADLVQQFDSASTRARPAAPLSPGTYWWRVAARDAQGRLGLFGSALPFDVQPMPSDAQVAAPSVKEGELVLRWRSVPEIQRYRVEVSRHADLRDPAIDTIVETPELHMKKPRGGRWYVRVHALDEDGEAMELGSIQEIRLPCVLCYAGGAASVALLLLAL